MTDPRLEEVASTFVAASGAPGVTLAVALPDGSVRGAAAGVARKSPAEAMSLAGRMPAGSIGKTYAAATLVRLLEQQEGGVAGALDRPISTWLGRRAWFGRLKHGEAMTLRQLLMHTSGISEHVERADFLKALTAEPMRAWSTDELAEFVCAGPSVFEPGAGWSYGDANYILVGAIIEELGGRAYYPQLRELVLGPMGLTDTIPQDGPELPGIVSGYVGEANLFPVPEEVAANGRYAMNPQWEYCGGGVVTTAPELARFFRDLFEGDLLRPESKRAMVEAAVESRPLGPEDKYGIGLQVYPSAHGMVWGHAGRFPGYCSIVAYWPALHASAAAQINCDHRRGVMNLRKLVTDALEAAVPGAGRVTSPQRQEPVRRDPASSGGS